MDAPYEIFNDKDIRMWATMILPGTQWKGQKIIIQGGFIRPDGSYVFRTDASTQGKGWKDLLFVWCAGSENVFGI